MPFVAAHHEVNSHAHFRAHEDADGFSATGPALRFGEEHAGDSLPDMPLFLCDDQGTNVPLEEMYQATWRALPREICRLLGEETVPGTF